MTTDNTLTARSIMIALISANGSQTEKQMVTEVMKQTGLNKNLATLDVTAALLDDEFTWDAATDTFGLAGGN